MKRYYVVKHITRPGEVYLVIGPTDFEDAIHTAAPFDSEYISDKYLTVLARVELSARVPAHSQNPEAQLTARCQSDE